MNIEKITNKYLKEDSSISTLEEIQKAASTIGKTEIFDNKVLLSTSKITLIAKISLDRQYILIEPVNPFDNKGIGQKLYMTSVDKFVNALPQLKSLGAILDTIYNFQDKMLSTLLKIKQ